MGIFSSRNMEVILGRIDKSSFEKISSSEDLNFPNNDIPKLYTGTKSSSLISKFRLLVLNPWTNSERDEKKDEGHLNPIKSYIFSHDKRFRGEDSSD